MRPAEEISWASQDWLWDSVAMTAVPRGVSSQCGSDGVRMSNSSTMSGSPSSKTPHEMSCRRAKAAPQQALNQCQVDGCTASLGTDLNYHQRYKICDRHLKVGL